MSRFAPVALVSNPNIDCYNLQRVCVFDVDNRHCGANERSKVCIPGMVQH